MTIGDIADRAGVAKSAVSYALNGKPGVSEETRRRVTEIAHELGWRHPSGVSERAGRVPSSIGLVLARPARTLGLEPYFMQFISGIESTIAPQGISLTLHVVPRISDEIAAYQRWWSARRVDGVILVDLTVDDPRLRAIAELGMPAVCAVGTNGADIGLPRVMTDDEQSLKDAVRYLGRLGHRRIAHVTGIASLIHTIARNAAFEEITRELGMVGTSFEADYTGEAGARATRALLTSAEPPTAIVYDNDIMAVGGLGVASELAIDVPGELSLLSFDDSALCELTHPSLSAMKRDPALIGAIAAEMLLEFARGARPEDRSALVPTLIPRASTGSAPDRAN